MFIHIFRITLFSGNCTTVNVWYAQLMQTVMELARTAYNAMIAITDRNITVLLNYGKGPAAIAHFMHAKASLACIEFTGTNSNLKHQLLPYHMLTNEATGNTLGFNRKSRIQNDDE